MSIVDNIYKLKVVLLGDMAVGKTSIAVRFTSNTFDEVHNQTIGVSYISRNVIVDDSVICYQIWDTAGQERFKALVPMYLRGAHIALVVYDVTKPESFANIGSWLEALRHQGDMVKPVIVANKVDMEKEVDDEMGISLARENDIQFFCVSAKYGYNIERLFHTMGTKVVAELKHKGSAPCTTPSPTIIFIHSDEDATDDDDVTSVKKQHRRRICCKH